MPEPIVVQQGGSVVLVEATDPYQFAEDWNASYGAARSAYNRAIKAWNELRAAMPQLKQHQMVMRERQLTSHVDAGEALNHIEKLTFDVEVPVEPSAEAIQALAPLFEINQRVQLQDLPAPQPAYQPDPSQLYEWNALLDRIASNERDILDIRADIKEQRLIVKEAQIQISNGKVSIAELQYDSRMAMIELRALQPILIALDGPDAPDEFHLGATVNLRVNVYKPAEMDPFCERIPSLRLSGVYADTS